MAFILMKLLLLANGSKPTQEQEFSAAPLTV